MALPGKPMVWSPRGASDTLDSSTAFSGAMAALQDLIPDPSTRDLWQCRPAAIRLTNFPGFTTPGFVSCMVVIGTRIYGMVATGRNAGQDEPFAYDIPTNTFITISGVTGANTPVSPATAGAWSPPTMELVGTKIICTHPGFTGAAGAYFGVLDITTPSSPAWSATNTTVNALPAVPTWVAQFNGRAWFLVNPTNAQPAAYFSDILAPTVITNAGQILTFEDNQTLTCAFGLPLENQLGGIIQSLIVFKGVSNLYQVTGDFAQSNLARNSLNVATGTFAPNTVATTNKGMAFVAPDGVRVIDFEARVSDPIGKGGEGVTIPFFFSVTPSRMAAAFNGGVYRVAVQNGAATGNPKQEWWYDFSRELWSGPHTINASLAAPYQNTFIVTLDSVGALWQSDQVQSSTSTYVENGRQLAFAWATPMLPDTDQMSEIAMIETTLHMAMVTGNSVIVSFQDNNGTLLDSVTLVPTGQATIWGNFQWGNALWQGSPNSLYPRQIPWHAPLVFRRGGLLAQGNCAAGLKVGRLHLRYQILGYLQQDQGGNTVFQGTPVVGSLTPTGATTPNSSGVFTLTANATQTVVNNANCLATSKVFIIPITPDAANDMATTSVVAGAGAFTVTHANNSRTDRTFSYAVLN